MPSMYEIYDSDAHGYDRLVGAEDYKGNLCGTLHELASWRDAVVVESGIGTGRVTRCYIDAVRSVAGCDRSQHMLDRAAANLSAWRERLSLSPADHRSLPVADRTSDVFIEGWAFGHSIVDVFETDARNVVVTAAALISEAFRVLRPGGTAILIETLGTNVDEPVPPHPSLAEFYALLETKHGFSRRVIRTDYRFESLDEAVEACSFFFGSEMGEAIRRRGLAIVPEFTGVWWRKR